MIKKQLFTLITFSMIFFIGCGDSNKKSSLAPEDEIHLEVELERNMTSKYPLDIIFTLTNHSDKTVYYDDASVPMSTVSFNIFKVLEDSVSIGYEENTAVSYGTSFKSIAAGERIQLAVSLDKIYKVTKGTHNYQISYKNMLRAKTSDGIFEVNAGPPGIPLEHDGLQPNEHTSKIVQAVSNTLEFEATIKQIRDPN